MEIPPLMAKSHVSSWCFIPKARKQILRFSGTPSAAQRAASVVHRVTWEGVDPRQLAARRGAPAEVAAEWSTSVPPQGWTLPSPEANFWQNKHDFKVYIYIYDVYTGYVYYWKNAHEKNIYVQIHIL